MATRAPKKNDQHDILNSTDDADNQRRRSRSLSSSRISSSSRDSSQSSVSSNSTDSTVKHKHRRRASRAPDMLAKCWDFFAPETVKNPGMRVCLLCNILVSTCGNTTNAWSHLKNNHRIQHDIARKSINFDKIPKMINNLNKKIK